VSLRLFAVTAPGRSWRGMLYAMDGWMHPCTPVLATYLIRLVS